jgi:hypothetical protein
MKGWKTWNGRQVEASFRRMAGQAVEDAVHTTGEVADEQVPHDTGELMQSKFIARDPSNELRTYIGYGGGGNTGFPKVPYAVRHHEIPANFQKGRKHNYLRDPVKTVLPGKVIQNLKQRGLK